MNEPKRIQRKRTKGWRMPEGAVYVGRPTRWGNPFVVRQSPSFQGMAGVWYVQQIDRANRVWHPDKDTATSATEKAIKIYRGEVGGFWNAAYRDAIQRELRGRDLACWCPLDQPCHADVLLELANRTPAPDAPPHPASRVSEQAATGAGS